MKLVKSFNQLQPRERLGATLAAAALVYFALDLVVVRPLETERKELNRQIAAQRLDLGTVKVEAAVATVQLAKDPTAGPKGQIVEYRKMTEEAAQFLSNADKQPRRVGSLLRQVIASSPGVMLVSLKTLPVATIYEAKPPAEPPSKVGPNTLQALGTKGTLPPAAGSAPGKMPPKPTVAPLSQRSVYRHGIEVTVRGNYLSMLPYLEQLQAQRLLWAEADLVAGQYPESTLRLTIYTIGTQPLADIAG